MKGAAECKKRELRTVITVPSDLTPKMLKPLLLKMISPCDLSDWISSANFSPIAAGMWLARHSLPVQIKFLIFFLPFSSRLLHLIDPLLSAPGLRVPTRFHEEITCSIFFFSTRI
jgi:hypothetical protein